MKLDRARRTRWLLGVAAITALPAAGCVRRTVTITTDPQGATVHLNDEDIGTTPVTVAFTWYGDYDVVIRHEGYETLSTHHQLERPWYQFPPIDFVAEVLIPATITDRRAMHFDLEPRQPVDRDQLVRDAVEFRERTLFGSD